MTHDLGQMTAAQLNKLCRRGRAPPVETVQAVLNPRDTVNPRINAFCRVDGKEAIAAARAAEKRWKKGKPLSAIDGVPVSIKELVRVKGWAASMGSKLTDKTPVDADAPAVARARAPGGGAHSPQKSAGGRPRGAGGSAPARGRRHRLRAEHLVGVRPQGR